MNWNDGLKLRPIATDGLYILACPSEDGVEIRMGKFDGAWKSAGTPVPQVIYFTEISGLPADAAIKARQIIAAEKEAEALRAQEEKARQIIAAEKEAEALQAQAEKADAEQDRAEVADVIE